MKGAKIVACKEVHADSRQRYSIMTCVQSYRPAGPVGIAPEPPRIAVLFKGKTQRILADVDASPWMLLQHTASGSYRTESVTEFLEFALPRAEQPQGSIIVMLDWYAPHCSAQVPSMPRVVCQRRTSGSSFRASRSWPGCLAHVHALAVRCRSMAFRCESALIAWATSSSCTAEG